MIFTLIALFVITSGGATTMPKCEDNLYRPPFTPRLNYWWSPTTFDLGSDVENFLAAGAKQFANDRLHGGKVSQHIGNLMHYVASRISYDETCITSPPPTFGEVVRNGGGSCLHINFLAAAALSRVGLRTQIVIRELEDGFGHLWVEIGDGVFIADATRGGFVVSPLDMMADQSKIGSFAARFYLHPKRIYHPVQ